MLTASPPTAKRKASESNPREEKSSFIEVRTIEGRNWHFFGFGGHLSVTTFDAEGDEILVPLELMKRSRTKNFDGTFRFYGEYFWPFEGPKTLRFRADQTEDDIERGIHRTENFRLIPHGTEDYDRLYPMRSDIESNNRQLEDTLWINRARSVGKEAQLMDLLGYMVLTNSVAINLHRRRQRLDEPQAA